MLVLLCKLIHHAEKKNQKDYWTYLAYIISLNLHRRNDTFLIPLSSGLSFGAYLPFDQFFINREIVFVNKE